MLQIKKHLCNLPHLSKEEFELACMEFADRSQRLDLNTTIVKSSGADGCIYLKISRQLLHKSLKCTESSLSFTNIGGCDSVEDSVDAIIEDDEAVVYGPSKDIDSTSIDYHVILSPTYRIPVLHLCFKGLLPHGLSSIDAAYRYLVPSFSQAQMQAVGVLGGISMINHPFDDLPCLTVHPCNASHAMEELVGTREISGVEYLQIWIGLVGGFVGLNLSKELAIELET